MADEEEAKNTTQRVCYFLYQDTSVFWCLCPPHTSLCSNCHPFFKVCFVVRLTGVYLTSESWLAWHEAEAVTMVSDSLIYLPNWLRTVVKPLPGYLFEESCYTIIQLSANWKQVFSMAVVQSEFRWRVLALDKEFASKKSTSVKPLPTGWECLSQAELPLWLAVCTFFGRESLAYLDTWFPTEFRWVGDTKPCQQLAVVTITNCSICLGGGEGKLFQVQQSKCQTWFYHSLSDYSKASHQKPTCFSKLTVRDWI